MCKPRCFVARGRSWKRSRRGWRRWRRILPLKPTRTFAPAILGRHLDDVSSFDGMAVVNVGHNLFDSPSDELRERIDAFMNGRVASATAITVELPDLAPLARAN